MNYDAANKQITVRPANLLSGNHTISKKGNGTPVLDIKGKKVSETFGPNVEKIEVLLSGIPCTNYSGSNVKLKAAQKAKREGKEYDESAIEKEYEAEALTFYVLTAIRAMNPRTVVVEEVVEYSESPASIILRTVLGQMGYETTETVAQSNHTKRKRWILVANMGESVDLTNLSKDNGKTIEDFLDASRR